MSPGTLVRHVSLGDVGRVVGAVNGYGETLAVKFWNRDQPVRLPVSSVEPYCDICGNDRVVIRDGAAEPCGRCFA